MANWVRLAHGGGGAFGTLNDDGSVALHRGDMFDSPTPTGETVPAASVVLRAPVRPGKFIGLWNNFYELAAKQGNTIHISSPEQAQKGFRSELAKYAALVKKAGIQPE